jgi:hypothetical protein
MRTARAFYLSPDGSDAADGAAPERAIKSFSRLRELAGESLIDGSFKRTANVAAASLVPGDLLLFASGGTYTDEYVLTGRGTAAAPIRVSSWGEGPKPLFRGAPRADGSPDTYSHINITVHNGAWFSLSDLGFERARLGIYLRYQHFTAGFQPGAGMEIAYCDFFAFNDGDIGREYPVDSPDYNKGWEPINEVMRSSGMEYAFSSGIFLGGKVPSQAVTSLDGWTVKDCSFDYCDGAIGNNWYYPFTQRGRIRNVRIEGARITRTLMGGVALSQASDVVVRDLEVREGWTTVFCFPGYSGLFLYGCERVLVEGAHMDYLGRRGVSDTCHADIEYSRDVTVRKSAFGNSTGQAIILLDTPPVDGTNRNFIPGVDTVTTYLAKQGWNEGIVVEDCVFWNNLLEPFPYLDLEYVVYSRNRNNTGIFRNNTFFEARRYATGRRIFNIREHSDPVGKPTPFAGFRFEGNVVVPIER